MTDRPKSAGARPSIDASAADVADVIRPRQRRQVMVAIVVFCLVCVVGGLVAHRRNSQVSAPSRSEFVQRIRDRDRVSEPTAECIADVAYNTFNNAGIKTIYDGGMAALPLSLWDQFGHGKAVCVFADASASPRDGTVADP